MNEVIYTNIHNSEFVSSFFFIPLHYLTTVTWGSHQVRRFEVRPERRVRVAELPNNGSQERLILKVIKVAVALILVIPATLMALTIRGVQRRYDSILQRQLIEVHLWQKPPLPQTNWESDPNTLISQLPREVFMHILRYVCPSPQETTKISLVCRKWHTAVSHIDLWNTLAKRYSDFIPNPKIHAKMQIRSFYQKGEATNYPPEIISLFGGFDKLVQLPLVTAPNFYVSNSVHNRSQNTLSSHPIVRFEDAQGCHGIAIRYIRHFDQTFLKRHRYTHKNFTTGRYEAEMIIYRPSPNWSMCSLEDPFMRRVHDPKWIDNSLYLDWMKRFLSGVPCGDLRLYRLTHVTESPAINEDGKPTIQLWSADL